MLVVFRTDSSTKIGSGHLMRCLCLADALATRGIASAFLTRKLSGSLDHLITVRGHQLILLPPPTSTPVLKGKNGHEDWLEVSWRLDADQCIEAISALGKPAWLVTDHYALDAEWETALKPFVSRIMAIDDLANRPHDCDLLLDQTSDSEERYTGWLGDHTAKILGPRYALLRPEFLELRNRQKPASGPQLKVLCFFGASAPPPVFSLLAEAIGRLDSTGFHFTCITGSISGDSQKTAARLGTIPNADVFPHVRNLGELMAGSDLFLGSGGTTTWERCCLGLPGLVISVAPNQEPSSRDLAEKGVIFYLGSHQEVTAEAIAHWLNALRESRQVLLRQGARAGRVVDGLGAGRVVDRMFPPSLYLRLLAKEDIWKVWEWRNHEENRRQSFDPNPISRETHLGWFERSLANRQRVQLMGIAGGKEIGVLRYDIQSEQAITSVYLNPDHFGRGFGTSLLLAGSEWMRENRPAVRKLIAEIRPSNRASLIAFQKAGYRELHSTFVTEL